MDNIPLEILIEIIKYLDLPDLFRLTLVSKAFNFDDSFYRYWFNMYAGKYNSVTHQFTTYKSFFLYICREEYFQKLLTEKYEKIYQRFSEQWLREDIYKYFQISPFTNSPYFDEFYSRISPRGKDTLKFKPNDYSQEEINYPTLDSRLALNILVEDENIAEEIYKILINLHYSFSMIRRVDYGHFIIEGKVSNNIWSR